MRENVNRLDGDGSHGRCTKCAVIFFHSKQALLGLFDYNFSYLIMPQRGLNPRQYSCTQLGPLKDAQPTKLQCRGNFKLKVASRSSLEILVQTKTFWFHPLPGEL